MDMRYLTTIYDFESKYGFSFNFPFKPTEDEKECICEIFRTGKFDDVDLTNKNILHAIIQHQTFVAKDEQAVMNICVEALNKGNDYGIKYFFDKLENEKQFDKMKTLRIILPSSFEGIDDYIYGLYLIKTKYSNKTHLSIVLKQSLVGGCECALPLLEYVQTPCELYAYFTTIENANDYVKNRIEYLKTLRCVKHFIRTASDEIRFGDVPFVDYEEKNYSYEMNRYFTDVDCGTKEYILELLNAENKHIKPNERDRQNRFIMRFFGHYYSVYATFGKLKDNKKGNEYYQIAISLGDYVSFQTVFLRYTCNNDETIENILKSNNTSFLNLCASDYQNIHINNYQYAKTIYLHSAKLGSDEALKQLEKMTFELERYFMFKEVKDTTGTFVGGHDYYDKLENSWSVNAYHAFKYVVLPFIVIGTVELLVKVLNPTASAKSTITCVACFTLIGCLLGMMFTNMKTRNEMLKLQSNIIYIVGIAIISRTIYEELCK